MPYFFVLFGSFFKSKYFHLSVLFHKLKKFDHCIRLLAWSLAKSEETNINLPPTEEMKKPKCQKSSRNLFHLKLLDIHASQTVYTGLNMLIQFPAFAFSTFCSMVGNISLYTGFCCGKQIEFKAWQMKKVFY